MQQEPVAAGKRNRQKHYLRFLGITGKSLSNDYDKILKENIAALLLPLTEKCLGIRIKDSRELKDKLQTRKIIERLTEVGQEEIALRKYVRQLSMLAHWPNLMHCKPSKSGFQTMILSAVILKGSSS